MESGQHGLQKTIGITGYYLVSQPAVIEEIPRLSEGITIYNVW
jgi:hypothetical protein